MSMSEFIRTYPQLQKLDNSDQTLAYHIYAEEPELFDIDSVVNEILFGVTE